MTLTNITPLILYFAIVTSGLMLPARASPSAPRGGYALVAPGQTMWMINQSDAGQLVSPVSGLGMPLVLMTEAAARAFGAAPPIGTVYA